MRKYSKVLCLILVAVMVVACLAACGGVSPEKLAEQAVSTCIDALKMGDLETAANYLVDADIIEAGDDGEDSAMNESMTKIVFGKLNYKILSSTKVDDSTVTVKVEISNVDMKPVFTEFFTQALQYAFANAFADPQPTEEETNQKMEEIFNSCISKEDLTTVTEEVDVKVVKDGDGWIIEGDDTLANALLGGLLNVVEELEDSFSDIGEQQ